MIKKSQDSDVILVDVLATIFNNVGYDRNTTFSDYLLRSKEWLSKKH